MTSILADPACPRASHQSRSRIMWLALFGTVFFLRLWLIREWGSPIPFWDQWDSEALQLYRPWLIGDFRWPDLFRAHNEHRIVLTRLIDLMLFTATGRWETWWQLVLNAGFNAATAAVVVHSLVSSLPPKFGNALILLVVASFATPSGWQNALWGFQSQCYLANGWSVIAIVCLLKSEPLRIGWWFGWFAAALAIGAQASGVFAALAAALVHLLDLAPSQLRDRRRISALFALSGLVALGLCAGTTVPAHSYLRAETIAQFIAVFTRCLAYPFIQSPVACLLLQAPGLWLVWTTCREPDRRTSVDRCALALVFLGALNGAAIAFDRGAGLVDHLPISRYQDGLMLGALGNSVALFSLGMRHPRGPLAAMIWVGLMLSGLGFLGAGSLTFNLPFKELQNETAATMITIYHRTRDPRVFETEPPFLRPHPNPRSVIAVLEDPVLAPILPVELHGATASKPWLIEYAPWLSLGAATLLAGSLLARCGVPKPMSTLHPKP
ncbi:MAG TPA: hypothetical protein VK178_04305 [Opitutaceae bacterium]|nr:hypothetical protein [Opitutaceae bacterium]